EHAEDLLFASDVAIRHEHDLTLGIRAQGLESGKHRRPHLRAAAGLTLLQPRDRATLLVSGRGYRVLLERARRIGELDELHTVARVERIDESAQDLLRMHQREPTHGTARIEQDREI